MSNTFLQGPKFKEGSIVISSKEGYGPLTIKSSRWTAFTWLYTFKETEARMGESYLSLFIEKPPTLVKDSWNREEVKSIALRYIVGYTGSTPPFDEWFDNNYPI